MLWISVVTMIRWKLNAMPEMEVMEESSGINRAYKTQQSTRSRRSFDRHGSHNNILRDHLGPDAICGKEFSLFFQLTRPREDIIIQQLGNSNTPFYKSFRTDRFGLVGP
jgi:hypothetical protein